MINMGSIFLEDSKSMAWKFTGQDECYPVELFIHLLESETIYSQIAKKAKQSICIEPQFPKLQTVVDNWGPDCSWERMKADLLSIFGRETPYTTLDMATLVRSLKKDSNECHSRFLLRVQWVLQQLPAVDIGNIDLWIRLLFLAGLEPSDADSQGYSGVKEKSIDDAYEYFKLNQVTVKAEIPDNSLHNCLEIFLPKKETQNDTLSECDYADIEMEIKPDLSDEDMTEEQSLKERFLRPRKKQKLDKTKQEIGKEKFISKKKKQLPTEENWISCEDCQETFRFKKYYTEHRLKEHSAPKQKKSYCGLCSEQFKTAKDLDIHEEKNHLGACGICSLEIFDLKKMRQHHKKDHKRKQAMCPDCNCNILYSEYGRHNCHQHVSGKWSEEQAKSFADNRVFRSKLRIHTLKEGEMIDTVKSMTFQFMAVENGVVKWFCGHCKQEFTTKDLLYKHIKTAHDCQVYRCDLCDKFTAKVLDNVASHKARIHAAATESFDLFSCQVCPFKCIRQNNFDSHMKNNHSEGSKEDRTCKVCGQQLSCPAALKSHVESVHMRMEKFKCKVCDKTFVSNTTMLAHMKKAHSVTKDVPVMCSICGSVQQNQWFLNIHMRNIHSGPKECPHCGRVMKNLGSLKNHIVRVHTGKDRHKCAQCDVSFAEKYKLAQHMKKAH